MTRPHVAGFALFCVAYFVALRLWTPIAWTTRGTTQYWIAVAAGAFLSTLAWFAVNHRKGKARR